MVKEFRISTNIERDFQSELDYIVTSNTNDVYNRIVFNYAKGQHSFSIIGSYGTGKSSFMWAFEKHLLGEVKFEHPVNGEFKGVKQFHFERFVGDNSSFRSRFCERFDIDEANKSNKQILKQFNDFYEAKAKKSIVVVLLVDEFGKHLEFASKSNSDELYFIQELAEYCNSENKKIIFITSLHQNFSAYAKGLSKTQKSEWDKVRGRLLDIAFDEPVEQLLFFAAKRLKSTSVPKALTKRHQEIIELVEKSGLLGKNTSKADDFYLDLFPLEPLAADVLTKALQRYGQNERSLFTFLESRDLADHIENKRFFTVADCFDYLTKNLSSEIEDGEKNPFKPQWKAAILALEKAEFLFHENFEDAAVIIKTICLTNIFSNSLGSLSDKILSAYVKAAHQSDTDDTIFKLARHNIIKFSNHRNKYSFIDGTDIDIEHELINAAKHIEHNFNLVNRLNSFFDFGVLPAKRIQFEKGTPRFFDFKIWDEFNYIEPKGEIDGYVNLIFTKKDIRNHIKTKSKELESAQLFVLFQDVEPIEHTIFEIDKINYVIGQHRDDKVALRILNEEKLFRLNQLERLVKEALFDETANVSWFYKGNDRKSLKELNIVSEKMLNGFISNVSDEIYHSTPVYLNEMVNKEFLTTPILTARKNLIKQLIEFGDEPDLGFDAKRFPPEKTIYLSLIKNTGIHSIQDGVWQYTSPSDRSFAPIWEASMQFIEESVNGKKPLSDLHKRLRNKPFKLKQGFLDFWIPLLLIIKKEDYALYAFDGEYIPHLTHEVMDLIHKHPAKYEIKGLSNTGVKESLFNYYKQLVDFSESNVKGLESSYITIYGNFLKFYRTLPEYSKITKQLPRTTQGVRDAIALAKDPETALFEQIPAALGYHNLDFSEKSKQLDKFLDELKVSIKQLRIAYDELLEKIEEEVLSHLHIKERSFDEYKPLLITKFKAINANMIINPQMRTFYNRVVSLLDVRLAYWESLSDAILGKRLDRITDEEIGILIDRLKENLSSLLDLHELHQVEVASDQEVVQLRISHSDGMSNLKKNIIVDKVISQQAEDLQLKVAALLNGSSEVNRLALLRLLEKELSKS